MLFSDASALLATLVAAPAAYVVLVLVVRLAGKRSLAKLNAFDFVVTVALGSVLASIAVSPSVSLAGGALAAALLLALQYLVSTLSTRVRSFQRLVKASPTLLLRHGEFLDEALAGERVTRSEVLQEMRRQGLAHCDDVAAVVLETDGSLSVIGERPAPGRTSTLSDVPGWS